MERSTVWSAVLPILVPAHLLEVRDLLTGKCEVAKVAAVGEYLDKDIRTELLQQGICRV